MKSQRPNVNMIMDDHNEIIEVLRTFSHQGNLVQVFDAEQALQPFRDETVSAMAEALKDPDADLRILAVQVLGELGSDTEPALPAMIKALSDPDRIVRIAAIGPVASFGEKSLDAIPILEKWIGGDDEFSHVTAAGHILMIDPSEADELLPVLIESLERDDCGIRYQTVWLLGQLGELARDAVPALKRMLEDEVGMMRVVVSEAILEITGDASDAVKVSSDLLDYEDGGDWKCGDS